MSENNKPAMMVTISMNEYERLLKADEILDALYAGGVDNWDWYYDSLKDAGLLDEEEDDE